MPFSRLLTDSDETLNFVIPADAGIQTLDKIMDPSSRTPAFAGATNCFLNVFLKPCASPCC